MTAKKSPLLCNDLIFGKTCEFPIPQVSTSGVSLEGFDHQEQWQWLSCRKVGGGGALN